MEEILDDNSRNDILKQVFCRPKKVEEAKVTPTSLPVSVSETKIKTFGELLDETVAKRLTMDKEVTDVSDNIREQVLKNSRLDLIGQFKF